MNPIVTVRTPASRFKLVLGVLVGSLFGALGAGIAGAATADAATVGAARADADVPSLVVHYSQQTLGTDSGVHLLYARIVGAAKQVCPDETIRSLEAHTMVQQCRQQAIARAVQQINNPRLAAVHANTTKNG